MASPTTLHISRPRHMKRTLLARDEPSLRVVGPSSERSHPARRTRCSWCALWLRHQLLTRLPRLAPGRCRPPAAKGHAPLVVRGAPGMRLGPSRAPSPGTLRRPRPDIGITASTAISRMHKKLDKPYYGTTNLRKRAKTRVSIVTNIDFDITLHCMRTMCAPCARHSHGEGGCCSRFAAIRAPCNHSRAALVTPSPAAPVPTTLGGASPKPLAVLPPQVSSNYALPVGHGS